MPTQWLITESVPIFSVELWLYFMIQLCQPWVSVQWFMLSTSKVFVPCLSVLADVLSAVVLLFVGNLRIYGFVSYYKALRLVLDRNWPSWYEFRAVWGLLLSDTSRARISVTYSSYLFFRTSIDSLHRLIEVSYALSFYITIFANSGST